VVILVVGCIAMVLAADETKGPKWKPLMDGKTLAGWHPVGEGTWTVEDGAFVGRADNTKLYGLLVTDKQFRDFDLRLKFKVISGDSGVYIRTIIKPPDRAHGLQIQVGPPGSGTGGIYESYGRGWITRPPKDAEKKFLKPKQWNELQISARGGHIVVHVNGFKTAELKGEKSRPQGHIALQMHARNPMHVMFKDIQIREWRAAE